MPSLRSDMGGHGTLPYTNDDGCKSGALAQLTSAHVRQFLVAGAIAIYLAIQVLVPLRHLVYPGNVSWTEEGHRFAWHMKLRSKSGDIRIFATDPSTGVTREIDPHAYLTPLQVGKVAFHPDMILQFSHVLADELTATNEAPFQITVCAQVTLNDRPPQLLIDPTVDLAAIEHSLTPASWILPMSRSEVTSAQCALP